MDRKVTDGVIRKLIDKWLKAGVWEDGKVHYPSFGTAQGGVASPLMSNLYLHYVLDEWFTDVVQPRMQGRSSLTRYCDDAVMVFERAHDCQRVYRALGKRLKKYGLELHAEKTRIVDFRLKHFTTKQHSNNATFNFLGFTHHWGKSRRGAPVVCQRTAKERLSKAIVSTNRYCKANRHRPLEEQQDKLSLRLEGHYAYFGITGNSKSLRNLKHQTERNWRKWLSRRSQKSKISWEEFNRILKKYPLPQPRIYHQYHVGK